MKRVIAIGSSEHLRGFSVCSFGKYLADCISFFNLFTVFPLRQLSFFVYGLHSVPDVTIDFGLALKHLRLVSGFPVRGMRNTNL